MLSQGYGAYCTGQRDTVPQGVFTIMLTGAKSSAPFLPGGHSYTRCTVATASKAKANNRSTLLQFLVLIYGFGNMAAKSVTVSLVWGFDYILYWCIVMQFTS